ncbi:hypothetical protein GOV13_00375 [Candidatus Pacearchaeota archaeon]|nr:hypothetical protein [Candidatus Pacearchaeota archaeon]
MINKKGLSGIITVVIIIGIALVAMGVVWYVLSDVLEEQTDNIAFSEKCLDVNVRATSVDCSNPALCSVTLNRKSGGDEIAGVKLVFKNNSDAASDPWGVLGNIEPLQTVTETDVDSGIANATVVEVNAYFEDEASNEKICSQTKTYEFG